MDENVRKEAEKTLAAVEELNAVVLPEPTPATDIVPMEKANKTQTAAIKKRMDEIDMENTQSIISFGSAAQAELQQISQSMLSDVRNKDVGPAGDSLRNIVSDGRVSLMFVVPGSNTVARVNGTAFLTGDPDLRARIEKKGRQPATVIVIEIAEIYTQCARALMRAGTWSGVDESGGLPTVGEILAEVTAGEEGGTAYDQAWAPRAAKTMW